MSFFFKILLNLLKTFHPQNTPFLAWFATVSTFAAALFIFCRPTISTGVSFRGPYNTHGITLINNTCGSGGSLPVFFGLFFLAVAIFLFAAAYRITHRDD